MRGDRAWAEGELDRFVEAYQAGTSDAELLLRFPGKTVGQFRGKAINMQLKKPLAIGATVLKPDNSALLGMRTVFPGRVRDAAAAPELLITGRSQRKLGGRVTKGAWSGFPIYSLTLEERATCPVSCYHLKSCMGNAMQWSWRIEAGPELEQRLSEDLGQLQLRHPGGFAVRLHVLGDFYSEAYVSRWAEWLDEFPALHVWGYTARDASDPIGQSVLRLTKQRWDRFAIRLSSPDPAPERAITLWEMPDFSELNSRGIIVCPAELGKTKGCNSCALCWSPAARNKTIAFLAHGGGRGRKPMPKNVRPGSKMSAAVEQHGSQRAAADALGISLGKLQRELKREAVVSL